MMKNTPQYLYGRNSVLEALRFQRVIKVFLAPNFSDRDIQALLVSQNILTERMENEFLTRLVGPKHQGIVATVKAVDLVSLADLIKDGANNPWPLVVMLDGLEDPLNFGAIIRHAAAFAATGIIIKKDRQVGVTPAVAKVASGALEHVAIAQVTNLSQAIHSLKEKGYWVVSTALEGAIDYREFDYRRPLVLVIGSEGNGVSRLVRDNSDAIVKIAMPGEVNSLNASAAAAIMLAHIHANRFPL